MMVSTLFCFILELLMAVLVSSSVIKSYQEFDLPVCASESVCSEIFTTPSSSLSRSFMNSQLCKCPSGQMCPSRPGTQTLPADSNKWFGLCTPVSELPSCEPGDVAGEIQINEFTERPAAKILCNCPISPSLELASQDAMQVVYHLTCQENFISKRARYGETSRHRGNGRFYFYKK